MNRRPFLIALAFAVPQQAFAKIDYKALCTTTGSTPVTVNSIDLVEAAIKGQSALSPGVFDFHRDGTITHDERMIAIFDSNYCGSENGKGRCKGKDEGALANIQSELRIDALGLDGSGLDSSDGAVTFGAGRLKTIPIGTPSADYLASNEAILHDKKLGGGSGEGPNHKVLLALDPAGRFYKLQCKPDDVRVVPEKPDRDEKKFNGFRLSKDIDGLTEERGGPDKLGKIDAAEISYVDDRENDNTTFNITATAGFDFSTNPKVNSIVFFRMERQRVRDHDGNPVANEDDISKFTGGYIYGADKESIGRYDLSAFYTADTEDDSKLGSFRMAWEPAFLQEIDAIPFGGSRDFWKGGPSWAVDAKAIAYGGYVFDAGTNADLKDKDAFVRAGGSIKATVWPAPDHPSLNRVSFDASAKHLFNIIGQHSVTWLTAGANFDIDAVGGNVILRFGYEKGDDEETLEHTDKIKMSLGVRF